MKRADDFSERREHLASLSDEALKDRFWALLDQLTDPLVKLARENTSPAIERSVLLRMGFSSLEAKSLADGCTEHGLLKHGAGNVLYRLAKARGCDVRTAGLALIESGCWSEAEQLFEGGDEYAGE